MILEPVQGESGIHPLDPELLAAAREACDAHDALLVFDEIQCGMGRTGTLWAWQQLGVEPDVMTVAKGLGGGLPIGACVAAPAHADVLHPGDHGSTFAGGPVVAAAANAVVDTVADDAFLAAVVAKGDRLATGLRELGLDVRGLGPHARVRGRRRAGAGPAGAAGGAARDERHRARHRAAPAAADRVGGGDRRRGRVASAGWWPEA